MSVCQNERLTLGIQTMHMRRWKPAVFVLLAGAAAFSVNGQGWTLREYPIPTANSYPLFITVGPDANVWFTEGSANKIGRLTPDGQFTEFDLPVFREGPGIPLGITTGPDGNIWFGLNSRDFQFGRITNFGAITLFSMGPLRQFVYMEKLTTGPDGNLWATLFCEDAVFRINPADGQFTRFAVPTGGACPYGIITGPDGNVWFTEHYRNKIGRVTPEGSVTEFRIGPAEEGFPDDIVLGPDGNLWATDNYSRLHRITPAGEIAEFPATDTSFSGIAVGADGSLWTGGNSVLSRNSILGAQRKFTLPDSDHNARALASGPDGSIWFVEAYTNAIGRLTPGSGLSILAPCRILDTRGSAGPALGAQSTRTFHLADVCGIPLAAIAVAVNVTVTNPTEDGSLVLYSTDIPRPATSNVSYGRGRTRASNAIVGVGADGAVAVFCDQPSGTADLVLDVVGYFPQ